VPPDVGPLTRQALLGAGASIVTDAVRLFVAQPSVTILVSFMAIPEGERVKISLSDNHTVRSSAVLPKRASTVNSVQPALTPTTVTLRAPDEAVFVGMVALGATLSMVNVNVKLLT
jgi:hypothetical protein